MVDLFEEHRAIVSAIDAIIDTVRSPGELDLGALARKRVRLAALLKSHLVAEDAHIFAPLRAMNGEADVPAVAALRIELQELRSEYSSHVGFWHRHAIDAT